MDKKEISILIKTSNKDQLDFILNNFIDKTKSINKEIKNIGLGMLLLILINYLIENKNSGGFNIGVLTLSDLSSLYFLLPLIFSFLLFRYAIISSHQSEIKNIIADLIENNYQNNSTHINKTYYYDLTRYILPVTILEEFNKINIKSKMGCVSMIILYPKLIMMILLPFLIIASWLIPQIIEFETLIFFNKISVILTIYLLFLTIYYFIKSVAISSI